MNNSDSGYQSISHTKPARGLPTALVLILSFGAFALGQEQNPKPSPSQTPSASTTPSPVPTPAPIPTPTVTPTPTPPADDQIPVADTPIVSDPDPQIPDQTDTDADDQPKKEKRGSWIPAPIPIRSPAFGGGMILGLGYVFKLKMDDKVSPSSTLGVATAFTSNGTRGIAFGGRLYLNENKYQTAFAFGTGRARYEFFGIGLLPNRSDRSVLMKQSGSIFFGEFLRNVGKNIFIGPRYQYRNLTVERGGTETPNGFEIPQIDLKSTTAAIGFHIQQDYRDNNFYPTKGFVWDFKADFFAKALGSNRTYQTYKASYDGFKTIGKGQVLAYRAMGCSASEKAPFFDLCLFGGSDLRGYTLGRFQNNRMFATQAEYRKELPWRLGLVGFAGVGGVADGWNKFRFKDLLPGGGVGLRFKLDKTNHINYRVDLGFGRTGYTVSLSVTEAF